MKGLGYERTQADPLPCVSHEHCLVSCVLCSGFALIVDLIFLAFASTLGITDGKQEETDNSQVLGKENTDKSGFRA